MLLFLLALAAVPGALLPQRSLNEGNVNEYIAENGWLGELYDRLPAVVARHVFSDHWDGRIVPAKWGDSSGVRGAARLWDT